MALIAWDELARRVDEDVEFRLASRRWEATLRLDLGSESHRLRFQDGRLREIRSCDSDAECDVHVSASLDEWEHLLAPVPRPFYQTMEGLGHFPMSEEPERFLRYLRPVLEKIDAAGAGEGG
jgi:pimeloyl-ACP methyl ester carboxylesterase